MDFRLKFIAAAGRGLSWLCVAGCPGPAGGRAIADRLLAAVTPQLGAVLLPGSLPSQLTPEPRQQAVVIALFQLAAHEDLWAIAALILAPQAVSEGRLVPYANALGTA